MMEPGNSNITSEGNAEAQERVPLLDQAKADADFPEISPQTISSLINRLRAMVLRLLPIEVDQEELFAPTSSILTKGVIQSFRKAGGDFEEAVPYCLLEASRAFWLEAQNDPANYDEGVSRSAACEALARKVLQTFHHTRQHLVLSARYRRIESDGDISLPLSAIELAADCSCSFFLSSEVCQRITFALWKGHLIQDWDSHGHTIFKLNPASSKGGFLAHFNPSRITAVPRWQNWLRILLWLLFLVTYSLALQTPDKQFGPEDIIFYIQVAGYIEEEVVRMWKIGPRAAIGFWPVVNYIIYAIASAAFVLRVMDIYETKDPDLALHYRRQSFYVLAMAAPLIWMKLLTVFDVYPFFGTMQIVVFRMMRETVIFFTLLLLLAIGFAQALLGLDNSDSTGSDSKVGVVRALTEGLLGSPVFDMFVPDEGFIVYPYGLIQYYLWTAATGVILLNVLVALFGTAYDSIVGDAANQYLVFFTGKVISLIRAPDQYVYPAPFNLIELLILPLELCLDKETYTKINTYIMSIIFCPVVCAVALWEGHFETPRVREEASLLEEEDSLEENPDTAEEDKAKGILSKESFDDLVQSFPDLEYSPMTNVLNQIKAMKEQLEALEKQLTK